MGLLDKLNEAQKEAVINTDGPIMVMAGAGSGKTRVLTHRIAYLVEELGIPTTDILAVTFTNKAANEMKSRVASLLDDEYDVSKMWVSTIHGLCYRILRRCMHLIPPFTKNFNIVDETESLKYIRNILKELEMSDVLKDKEIQKLISVQKNGDAVIFGRDYVKQDLFDKVYNLYNEALAKDNCLDFDDLIMFTLKVFKEQTHVLEYYQDKFQYVMIDEFQDTNVVQYNLIKMLSFKHQNIFIVGDQDQSIYKFRGAKVENIDKFRKDFPLTKIILLEENYRSTKGILDLANEVISKNTNRIKKNLFTQNKSKNLPIFYQGTTSFDELSFIVFKMERLMEKYNYNYSDFAIIYRSNYLSRPIEDEFVKRGIRYQIYGGMSYFARAEVKDMVAYLSLILDTDNDYAFKRIVNTPKRKIGDALITKLMAEADVNNCSLFNAIDTVKASGVGYNNLLNFKFTILEIKELLNDTNLEDIIDVVLEKTGYKDYLISLGEEGEDRLQNVKELKSILFEANDEYEGDNIEKLSQITQALALRTDMDKVDEKYDSVRLMTYHQAKGLEFKVVFMVAMEEGIFPNNNCQTEEDLEEERRICYVGITRAQERLYITAAKSRNVFGSTSNMVVSRFIDTESELLKVESKKSSKPKEIIKEIKEQKTQNSDCPYSTGDKIEHKVFGKGIVVSVNAPTIEVAFMKPYGIKKLHALHPAIRKI